MKNSFLLFAIAIVSIVSCKEKPKEEEKKFISVLSLLEKQVQHIDTSLYSIVRTEYRDSSHTDTTYINRENFRAAAKDFLEIPDLSDTKVARKYKEETMYDNLLNRVIIIYTTTDENMEIKKQELQVTPNIATGDQVNNIIINRVISNRDGYLEKKMLWQMDKSFQVITTTRKPGEKEIITTTKVTWNEDGDQ